MKMNTSSPVKKFYLVMAILVIGLPFSATIYAQVVGGVIKACVNASGAMYIVGDGFKKTTCAKGEQLLSWNQQGPKGDKGDKGDIGPTGPAPHLFDANSQDLGVVVGRDTNGDTQTFIPGSSVFIGIVNSSPVVGLVLYLQDNCAGTPFTSSPFPLQQAFVLAGTSRFFEVAARASNTAKSVLLSTGCEATSSPTVVSQLEEITPPFSVPIALPLTTVMN